MNNFIKDVEAKKSESRQLKSITVNEDTALDVLNIGSGAFYPMKGFMTSRDYHDVVENMHLECGSPWTLPITLDVKETDLNILKKEKICLKDERGKALAILHVEDVFKVNRDNDILKVFEVDDRKHPGVFKECARSSYRAGGNIEVFPPVRVKGGYSCLLPEEAKKAFKKMEWKTITGFQTRNPIHRAHEYLQRIALEITDGLFIHPLIGWIKGDDFAPEVVVATYQKMVKDFYSDKKVILSFLRTAMRYAGPREAVFHAIVRRNFGCTHFIVGRDHAGVGGYYGKYDAHKLFTEFGDLGIHILKLRGPYYCKRCRQIVTDHTCRHGEKDAVHISGTTVRRMLKQGKLPPEEYMRKEIAQILLEFFKSGKAFYEDK